MNEIAATLHLGAVLVKPPKVAADGTQAAAANCRLQLESHNGRADSLLSFVGTCCGEPMAVRISPVKEDGGKKVAPWEGRAFVGPASCAPPSGDETVPRVKFSLLIEQADDLALLGLLKMRLAMMDGGAVKAEVRLALEQGRLDFEEDGGRDGGDPAA